MTYREALTDSMQTWKTEDIVIGGEIVQKGGKEMLSMSFPYFIKNMAGILAGVVFNNKPEYHLTEFIETVSNTSGSLERLPLETTISVTLVGFMQWLLSQEIEEEDEIIEKMWYDYPSLVEKWNEYFGMEEQRGQS